MMRLTCLGLTTTFTVVDEERFFKRQEPSRLRGGVDVEPDVEGESEDGETNEAIAGPGKIYVALVLNVCRSD